MGVGRTAKSRKIRRSKGKGRLSASASGSHKETNNTSSVISTKSKRSTCTRRKRKGKQNRIVRISGGSAKLEALSRKFLEQNKEKGLCDFLEKMETKQVILKLLGDKSSASVRCYDAEASLLQDMDLMVLGSSAEEYKRYAKLLRQEYSHMSDVDYKQMRLKLLNAVDRNKVHPNEANEEQPTTSVKAKAVKQMEEEINQIISTEPEKEPPRLYIHFDSPSTPLILTRRLLCSIKERENKKNKVKRLQRGRRLLQSNESRDNSNSHEVTIQEIENKSTRGRNPATATSTLEDGEILSEDDEINEETLKESKDLNNKNQEDVGDNNNNNHDDDDDDCVCIERTVELITIDDETDPTPVSIRDTKAKKTLLITSTPHEKFKTSTSESKTTNANTSHKNFTSASTVDGRPIFYKDSSYQKWLETIVSNDTFLNYTPADRSRRSLRRSQRLKNKITTDFSKSTLPDVIILDDSTLKPMKSRTIERLSSGVDDSVIFVSESAAPDTNDCPTFIPLEADDVPNPIPLIINPITPKAKHSRDSLFTKSEKKQLNEYNDNAYNPGAAEKLAAGKRMVIIDGSNVAFNHALNKEFSVKGLKICLQYFEKMGHEVKAVVPQFRLNRYKSSDPDELNTLHRAGKIVFTPCKNLPNTRSISYDDRFILQLACELDAAIVSNDNYRDLINENSAFKKIIENRVTGYTWCNDIFILPKDPYGKWGPPLHSILNRS